MSAPKKQTAVEWLVEQIQLGKIEIIYSNEIHSIKFIPNIIEQAKEMEKEQIMDAYEQGNEDGYWHPENGWNKTFENPEQYYNENYD